MASVYARLRGVFGGSSKMSGELATPPIVEQNGRRVALGSAAGLLRAMQEPPHPSASDVAQLEAEIAAARIPMQKRDLFTD